MKFLILVLLVISCYGEERPNPNEMFKNIEKSYKEEDLEKLKTTPAKRYKAKFEAEKRSNNQLIDKLLTQETNTSEYKKEKWEEEKEEKRKIGDEEYIFFSKVQKLLAKYNETEYTGEQGESKVRVIIDKNGKFEYKFIRYSYNEKNDKLLKDFLEKQKNIKYPIPPTKKSLIIDVDFKAY